MRMFSFEIFMVVEARVPLLPSSISAYFPHTPKARSVAGAGNQRKLEGISTQGPKAVHYGPAECSSRLLLSKACEINEMKWQ